VCERGVTDLPWPEQSYRWCGLEDLDEARDRVAGSASHSWRDGP
jgi:hypothetical protein